MIAVGHRALVLHARVGHLDQFVAVLLEGILSEVMVVGLHHARHLRELPLRSFHVRRQHIVVERQVTELVAEVNIVADI